MIYVALAWSVAQCCENEIDTLNILHATMLAMRRAIEGLHRQPTLALIDGNRCPPAAVRCEAIVGGDDLVEAISAASILAKTGVNPMVVAVAAVQRPLAEHVLLAVPAAIALGVVFYRSLLRRFERMEAPLRAKVYDSWFVEI